MNILKKRMTLIAYLFLRLRPAKIVVRYMCKKSRFRLPLQKDHGKRVSNLLKSEGQHLQDICSSTGREFGGTKFLLVIWKSLRLFVNTMSAVDKCSLPNRDNLIQPIHMQLSQKLKTFSRSFNVFSNLGQDLKIFKKRMTLIAYLFMRLRPAKNVVRYMCKSPGADYTSKRNMVNGFQLCLNMSECTCGIFVAQGEDNLVAKSLF